MPFSLVWALLADSVIIVSRGIVSWATSAAAAAAAENFLLFLGNGNGKEEEEGHKGAAGGISFTVHLIPPYY